MTEQLPDRINYWLKEAKHDCFFVLGPENGPTETVGAMKTLLMGDSEPFRAMLQDSVLAEKGNIRVTDVEPETFRTFLKCVYGGSSIIIPTLSFEENVKLMYVTDKYLIKYLKTEVSKYMKRKFSYEDVFIALSHPICYEDLNLKKELLTFLKLAFKKITGDDRFLELDKTSIIWILQQESTVKEIEIWNAILRWAKHKACNNDGTVLRSFIFDFLKYLRFLTMDYTEFWEGVVSSEILLEEEINDICKAFVSGKQCSIVHLCKNKHNRYNIKQVSENIITSFLETPKYAFIYCSVSSVSSLHFTRASKSYHWSECLWNIRVTQEMVEEKDFFSVYVGCTGTHSDWNCIVDVEISLINHIGKPDTSRSYTTTFTPSTRSWGFPSFYNWIGLLDPDNGFIKDDIIILTAKIKLHNGQGGNS